MSDTPPPAENDSLLGWLKTHPWLVALNLAFTVAGPLLVLAFFPEWETWRSVAAGLIGGAGFGYLVTCTRLVGGARD